MIKKEVSEIKKQFKPSDCTISRICTCYVNGEKEILSTSTDAFCLFRKRNVSNTLKSLRNLCPALLEKI